MVVDITIVAVIPAYNEERSIGNVIARAQQHVDEVLVIDDYSSDSTRIIAQLMGATVIRHDQNAGKSAALKTAFKWAVARQVDVLVTLDADGKHNPDEIPGLIKPILWQEADLVNGARFLEGHDGVPVSRRIGQVIATFAVNVNSNVKVNDSQSGFRAFSKKCFEVFEFNSIGMGIESEMIADAAAAGLRIKEVPITCCYDVDGSSSNPITYGLDALNSIVDQLEHRHSLLYLGVPGAMLFCVGIALSFQMLYTYQHPGDSWFGKALAAMIFTLFGTFGMFTGLILNSLTAHVANAKNG